MTDTIPESELAEMAALAADVAAQDAAEAPQDEAPADEAAELAQHLAAQQDPDAPAIQIQGDDKHKAPEPPKLTDEQKKEAKRLRVEEGLLLAEIADRLQVPMKQVSSLLLGVVQGKKKTDAPKNPNRVGAAKHRGIATADWPTFILGIPQVAGGVVPWPRAAYCLVRADSSKTGVQKGKVFSAEFAFPWATVCGHGEVKGAMKGAAAEINGKKRDEWCTKCAEGVPMDGLQPLPKTEGPEPAPAEGVAEGVSGVIDLRPFVEAEGPATSRLVPQVTSVRVPQLPHTLVVDPVAALDQALEVQAAMNRAAKQKTGEQATEQAKAQAKPAPKPRSNAARNATRNAAKKDAAKS